MLMMILSNFIIREYRITRTKMGAYVKVVVRQKDLADQEAQEGRMHRG